MTDARTGLDLERCCDVAVFAARSAGDLIRRAWDTPPDPVRKGRADWVSEVDHRAEDVVRDILAASDPDLAFIGEESVDGGIGPIEAASWVVDPLDGTTNFLRRHPAVGVSIGLVDGDDLLVGVVHAPILGETYTAVRGGGAFRDGRPITVSDRPVVGAVCATGFPFRDHQRERFDEYRPALDGVLESFEDLRRVGAAALDLAWVASGTFDGYFELGLAAWDLAAGVLLVREAGGVASDWAGGDDWFASGDIVVGNPAVHARLVELTSGSG